MDQVSLFLKAIFTAITFLAVLLFYKAGAPSKSFLPMVVVWMMIQLYLGLTFFYELENTIPPRFSALIVPPLILTLGLFATQKGRAFLDRLDLKRLTLFHTIRVPVELVLYGLFISKAVPQIMTFEGRNFDILAGLTAPLMYYFVFRSKKISPKILMLWNLISLGLLINIVCIAILSAKTPLQRFAFDQPNIAIQYFPFNWLPSVAVPLVFIAHLSALKQLLNKKMME